MPNPDLAIWLTKRLDECEDAARNAMGDNRFHDAADSSAKWDAFQEVLEKLDELSNAEVSNAR